MRRILTAIILIPLVVGLVLWGHPTILVAVQAAITLLALWEWFRIAEAATGVQPQRTIGYIFGLGVALSPLANEPAVWMLGILVLFLLCLAISELFAGDDIRKYLSIVATTALGVLYVAIPMALLSWVALSEDGRFLTLFTLVVIWCGDSAGFFVGRSIGKHRSSPIISPKKTWEGTIGSFIAAILVGAIAAQYFWGTEPTWMAVVLAAGLNIAGQLGDLAESAFKRSAGVKDSSGLIPGHGGVLDRIDALLLAAPILWYYWLWTMLEGIPSTL